MPSHTHYVIERKLIVNETLAEKQTEDDLRLSAPSNISVKQLHISPMIANIPDLMR